MTKHTEAEKQFAASFVATAYRGFDIASLEEILAVGLRFEAQTGRELPSAREEVLLLNEALAAEIERRKAAGQ